MTGAEFRSRWPAAITTARAPSRTAACTVEGCAVTYLPMEPEEVFHRAFKHQEFDVCELSFSSYLRTVDAGNVALCRHSRLRVAPVPPFRHLYPHRPRHSRAPHDLKGKLIGLPEYQITAVVWLRGIMQDEYGVKPTDIRWRQGGIEEPGRTRAHAAETDSRPRPASRSRPTRRCPGMLEAGELDAMFSARAPSCFMRGAPNVGRLFPDYREVEKAYYKKTGMFPIMHLIGVKRANRGAASLAAGQPVQGVRRGQGLRHARGAATSMRCP